MHVPVNGRRPLYTCAVLAGVLLLIWTSAGPHERAQAADFSFTVNAVNDLPDAAPGNGICSSSANSCTLRAAIQEANALPAGDTVTVHLPANAQPYLLTLGALPISHAITILGGGMASTLIDGNQQDRVFDINTSGSVSFRDLTVQHGALTVSPTQAAPGADGGGGIRSSGTGILTLTNVSVSNNIVTNNGPGRGSGGGLADVSRTPGGSITLDHSIVSNNTVKALSASVGSLNGGGIGQEGSANITLTDSTVSNNTLVGPATGANQVTVNGGGIVWDGDGILKLLRTTVSDNSATTSGPGAGGGGIAFEGSGQVNLTDSLITGNTVQTTGATSQVANGGGIIEDADLPMTLTNVTVSNNHAIATGATRAEGGGVDEDGGGSVTMINVTITGNTVSSNGGVARGGGIIEVAGAMFVLNGTIDRNSAAAGANAANGVGAASVITLKNTLLAEPLGGGSNCTGTISSSGHNLASDSSCALTGPGDLQNTDPQLGPLTLANGGPTPTQAIPATSPAVNAGSADCPPPATDQRGITRPQGPACDIGAYEVVAAIGPPSADLAVTMTGAPNPATAGQPVTYTVTVSNAGPSTATSVQLSDTLPANATFGSATPGQGTCTSAAGTLTCALGSLVNGASTSVKVVVTPTAAAAGGVISNRASVSATETDPVAANNTASLDISVATQPVADLALSLDASSLTPPTGSNVTLTVTVQNGGPDGTSGVLVHVKLPAGLAFVSATPAAAYNAGSGSWTVGTLAKGASATLTIVATIGPLPVDVTAAVSASSASDPNPGNNQASVHLVPTSGDIIVNDNSMAVNPNDGKCTLVEAIIAANTKTPSGAVAGECAAGGATSTIVLQAPAKLFSLNAVNNSTAEQSGQTEANGLPVVTSTITVKGGGAAIARAAQAPGGPAIPVFRLLMVAPGGVLTLNDLAIQGGAANHCGGGLYNEGTLTLINGRVEHNTVTNPAPGMNDGFGGGICNWHGTLTLDNSAVAANFLAVTGKAAGGGIYSLEGSLTLTNHASSLQNRALSNALLADGGGIAASGGQVNLTDSTVGGPAVTDANAASRDGGGIALLSGSSLSLTNAKVSNNFASRYGGGISNDGGSVTATGTTTIDRNSDTNTTVDTTGGAGIYNGPGGSLSLTDTTLSANHALGWYGALQNAGTATLTHVTITGNSTTTFGGGAIGNTGSLTITNSTITQNSAGDGSNGYGGAIEQFNGTTVLDSTTLSANVASAGGAAVVWRGTLTLRNGTVVSGNRARATGGSGGGIFVLNPSGTSKLEVIDSTVRDNTAPNGPGGGIYTAGPVTLSGATISGNIALDNGGGIYNDHSTVTATGSFINLNQVTDVKSASGGGIFNSTGASLSLTDTSVSQNTSALLYGGLTSDGTATLTRVTMSQNKATRFGGGAIGNTGKLTATDSTLSGNITGASGGALEQFGGAAIFDNSTLSGNTANQGGAIALFGGTLSLRNGTIVDGNSSATLGGGIYVPNWSGSARLTLSDSTVSNNTAKLDGGGIAVGFEPGRTAPTLTLTHATITHNSAVRSGGGIFNDQQSTVTVTDSSIDHNHATDVLSARGGGIFNTRGGSISLTDTAVSLNTSAVWYGGLENDGTAALTRVTMSQNSTAYYGGGAIGNTGSLTISNSTLSQNSAGDGTNGYGGAIEQYAGTTVLDSTTLSANIASAGGAMVVWGGTLSLRNGSVVAGNTARAKSGTGGGILIYGGTGTVNLIDSTLRDNTAPTGSGGGAWSDGTLTFLRSTVSGNTAGGSGGGIFLSGNTSTTTIVNSTISGNQAANGGGIAADAGTLSVSFATIAANQAQTAGGGLDFLAAKPAATITDTIITGNQQAGSTTVTGADCAGALHKGSGNLTGKGTGCPHTGKGHQTVEPATVFTAVLGPLADNGGPTKTHALLAGSPAIDAGPATCAAAPVNGVDQRGTRRPQGAACDTGAFER